MQIRTLTTESGDSLQTFLTDEQAKFLASSSESYLANKLSGLTNLTVNQLYWLHFHALQTIKTPPSQCFEKIIEFLNRPTNLKAPELLFSLPEETPGRSRELRLRKKGDRSRDPGSIDVKLNQIWQLTIRTDGKIQKSGRSTTDSVLEFLTKLNDDPEKTIKECGKLSGKCCFCAKTLADPRSLEAGYGATCARNYNLPY